MVGRHADKGNKGGVKGVRRQGMTGRREVKEVRKREKEREMGRSGFTDKPKQNRKRGKL